MCKSNVYYFCIHVYTYIVDCCTLFIYIVDCYNSSTFPIEYIPNVFNSRNFFNREQGMYSRFSGKVFKVQQSTICMLCEARHVIKAQKYLKSPNGEIMLDGCPHFDNLNKSSSSCRLILGASFLIHELILPSFFASCLYVVATRKERL